MTDSTTLTSALVRHNLRGAIETGKAVERQLQEFAGFDGDDAEVQDAFAAYAQEARIQLERLALRMGEIGPDADEHGSELPALVNVAPELAQPGRAAEERTLQNLISSYTATSGECAMYQVIESFANTAGDVITAELAREIRAGKQAAAEQIFHFIPSRAKIAFNMLTPSEIDPAVETRAADDRLIES